MSGLRFDGARDTSLSRTNTALGAYTWSGWFKRTSNTGYGALFGTGQPNSGGSARIAVIVSATGELVLAADSNTNAGSSVGIGEWHHVVLPRVSQILQVEIYIVMSSCHGEHFLRGPVAFPPASFPFSPQANRHHNERGLGCNIKSSLTDTPDQHLECWTIAAKARAKIAVNFLQGQLIGLAR